MRILSLFIALCLCLALPEYTASGQELDEKTLRVEIQLLNLLNGLYLSPEQMSFLIDKATHLEAAKNNYTRKHKSYSYQSTESLKKLKEELINENTEVSKGVAHDVHKTSQNYLKLKAAYEEELARAIDEVKANLTSAQLHILDEFKPCLMPPKGPARFGQSEGAEGLTKQLERIRQAPDHVYSVRRYEIANKMIEKLRLHKPKGVELDEDAIRDHILSVYERARELDEIDFNLEKEALAKQLKEGLLPQAQKKELPLEVKIENYLLNPVIVGLLEDKLSATSSN